LLGGLVFLSVAKSKLITYALPLYPAIAILAGHACKQWLEGEMLPIPKKVCVWIFNVSCLAGTLVPLSVLVTLDRYNHESSPLIAYFAAAVATTPMLVALVLMQRKLPVAALAFGALWFPLMFVTIMTWPMQKLAANRSQRDLAFEIRAINPLPNHIYLVAERLSSLIFYLNPDQRRELGPGQIVEVDPGIISHADAIPPNALLAMKTETRARLPDAALSHYACQLPVGGDYCILKSVDLHSYDHKTQRKTAW
jgi:hypothetical protein